MSLPFLTSHHDSNLTRLGPSAKDTISGMMLPWNTFPTDQKRPRGTVLFGNQAAHVRISEKVVWVADPMELAQIRT